MRGVNLLSTILELKGILLVLLELERMFAVVNKDN
jgi:hypothetical protein